LLQLVVSSDLLSSVWQPLTQLDLSLSECGDKKHVQLELDQSELKKLVTSLEAADRVCLILIFCILQSTNYYYYYFIRTHGMYIHTSIHTET